MGFAPLVEAPRPSHDRIAAAATEARSEVMHAPFFWIDHSSSDTRTRGVACRVEQADAGEAFVRWRWDGHRLLVENDRFGLIPTYLYSHGHEFAVSTSIERLAAAGAVLHLDRTALAVFLRLGFFVGDDTPFVEIRALPPGARLTWESGRLTISGRSYTVPQTTIARDVAIDRAIELTAHAIRKRVSAAPFAIPLSGGRDSRHLLLGLVASGLRPAYTITVPRFPPVEDEDQRVAARLSAALHVPHVLVTQTSDPAPAEARKNVVTDYCTDEHAWFLPMFDQLRGGLTSLYEGIGGSLWTTGWLPDVESRTLWHAGRTREVACRMLERHRANAEHFVSNLLQPGVCTYEEAIDRLAVELEHHLDAIDPGKSFHFWNRLRRELALVPFGTMNIGDVFTPLVDRELVEFLLSLEPAVISPRLSRADKSFHSEAIWRAYPQLANIPFELEGATRGDATAHNQAFTTAVATHLRSTLRRSQTMRSSYVWPRIAYTLLNGRYAASSRWFAHSALYLSQVEAVLA